MIYKRPHYTKLFPKRFFTNPKPHTHLQQINESIPFHASVKCHTNVAIASEADGAVCLVLSRGHAVSTKAPRPAGGLSSSVIWRLFESFGIVCLRFFSLCLWVCLVFLCRFGLARLYMFSIVIFSILFFFLVVGRWS